MSDDLVLIKNIKKLFCGTGLIAKRGRNPHTVDLDTKERVDIVFRKSDSRVLKIDTKIDDSLETYDASENIVCPAWIDSHTHSIFGGQRSAEYFMRWADSSYEDIAKRGGGIYNTVKDTHAKSDSELIKETLSRLKKMRISGSSVVEIKTGYSNSAEQELRLLRLLSQIKTHADKDKACPTISVTYLALHALPKDKNEKTFVDEMISILPTVKKECLADHVDAFPELGFFSPEASLRFAKEALGFGLKAKVHCDELNDLRSSESFIKLGARSIDHLQKISTTARTMLATSDTVATLMPATSFYLCLDYANARALLSSGASLALATDYNPGTAPNSSMSFTQTLASANMKMTPPEIFAASTHNAALALGYESGFGTIREGEKCALNFFKEESLEELFFTTTEPIKTLG